MTAEMGKPIAQAEAEVEKCATTCDWFADHAAALLEPEPAATEAAASYVRFDPLGVVLAVMPWNFPFWQVIRCAAPALAAGNTVVLKHASNVPGCALALEERLPQGRLPRGRLHHAARPRARGRRDHRASRGARGLAHRQRSRGPAGGGARRRLAQEDGARAGRLGRLRRAGGRRRRARGARRRRSPAPSTTARAASPPSASSSRSRSPRASRRRFVASMAALRVGDPRDRATQVGPLARPDLVDELEDQVRRTVAAGAALRLGGRRQEGPGCFFPPTVLTGVEPGHGGLRRGDLRPGRAGDARPRRRARARAGEPLALRARRQHLDRATSSAAARWPRASRPARCS